MKIRILLILTYVLCGFAGQCHVTLDSPAGGEMYGHGDLVAIMWHETVAHNTENWDLYYSIDDGVTWSAIAEDIGVDVTEYMWTIPTVETSTALVRVVQDNESIDYEDISSQFSISEEGDTMEEMEEEEMTVVLAINDLESTLSFNAYPNPFQSQISFVIPEEDRTKPVSLSVYAINGHRVATLARNQTFLSESKLIWQPANLNSGVYFVHYLAGANQETLQLIYTP